MPLWRHAVPTAALATGAERAVLVSEHGFTLAAFDLPYPPLAPPVLADFNGDGLTDVIVVTARGVFAYAQLVHYGGLQLGALLLALIAAMGVVWWSSQFPGGAGGGDGKQRRLRSTDVAD
jgi:hypothetical protein